jgi:hypothetical protein
VIDCRTETIQTQRGGREAAPLRLIFNRI